MSESNRNLKLFVSNLGSIVGPDRILYKPGDPFPVHRTKQEIVEAYLDSGQLVASEEEVGDPIDIRRAGGEVPVKGPKREGEALTEREFNLKNQAGGDEQRIRAERDRMAREAAERAAEAEADAAELEVEVEADAAELEVEVEVEVELEEEGVDLADFEDMEMSEQEARELGIID